MRIRASTKRWLAVSFRPMHAESSFFICFVHYCDGSSYSSYRADPVPVGGNKLNITQIFFRGRANLVATTAWLLAAEGMTGATDVILTGGSAGGMGVVVNVDALCELLPTNVRVVGMLDAGFFLDRPRASSS